MHDSYARVLALSTVLTLSACGGGGGGSNPSTSSNNSGGGNTTVQALTSTCQAAVPSTAMLAIAASGGVASASLTISGATVSLNYAASTLNNERALATQAIIATSSDGTCAFTATNQAQGLKLALASSRLGLAYDPSSGEPVLLLGSLNSTISDLAGTYNMVRYQRDVDTTNQNAVSTRTSYATFVVNGDLTWALYKNADASGTATATGTLETDGVTGRLLLVTGSGSSRIERGSVFLSGSGGERILAVAEHDPSNDGLTPTSGLFIGTPQAAWSTFSTAVAGSYVTNSTDPSTQVLSVSGLTLTPAGRSAVTATADSPIQGLLTAQSTNQVLLRDGLIAVINNETTTSGTTGYLQLGVVAQP